MDSRPNCRNKAAFSNLSGVGKTRPKLCSAGIKLIIETLRSTFSADVKLCDVRRLAFTVRT